MNPNAPKAAAWHALTEARSRLAQTRTTTLFEADPARCDTFCVETLGLLLDYSKQGIDRPARDALLALADACGLADYRERMFAGEAINATEGRAVLHTALRDPEGGPLLVDGVDVRAALRAELEQMCDFAQAVRQGELRTNDGGRYTTVVNIGIGGSDLGPKMVIQALAPYVDSGLTFHFLSNPDSHAVFDVLDAIDPARTLFLVSSKTFTTQDTLANFRTALARVAPDHGSEAAAMGHFCAITAAPDAARALGFSDARIFRFGNWVGGRYSLWSSIGMPIVLAIGAERFRELLAGARAMDLHFRNTPWAGNMPVLMALCGIWNHSVQDMRTLLVVPYDARLAELPAYIQQLDMESNGKRVDLDGQPLTRGSGPVVWGGLGINGQHAFFQLVHQGSQTVPVEFLGVLHAEGQSAEHQRIVFSNLLAQAEALMCGRSRADVQAEMLAGGMPAERAETLAGHRTFPGNIPSSTLLIDTLTPGRLGSLVALYEHKVFTQGVLWGINSFDQWGVELGKQLGRTIYQELCQQPDPALHDPSTRRLVARVFAGLK